MSEQPTHPGKDPLHLLPNDPQRGGAAVANSLPADFPQPGQASGWRRLLPWVFGLLTLVTLVLIVLHFGTIEQFTRLALAAQPE
jgi:hypothetical protein